MERTRASVSRNITKTRNIFGRRYHGLYVAVDGLHGDTAAGVDVNLRIICSVERELEAKVNGLRLPYVVVELRSDVSLVGNLGVSVVLEGVASVQVGLVAVAELVGLYAVYGLVGEAREDVFKRILACVLDDYLVGIGLSAYLEVAKVDGLLVHLDLGGHRSDTAYYDVELDAVGVSERDCARPAACRSRFERHVERAFRACGKAGDV